ncbi:OmpH family outer membrane protein [Myxococcota bacterium]|nr:OmpH family outer membrane protein [Myxococcota bacterium]
MRTVRVLLASLALAAAPAVVPALSSPAHAEVKVAVVDFQEAINQVRDGVAAKGRLEGMFAAKKKAIEDMEKRLMALQDEYQKQAMVLSDAARSAKEQEIMTLQSQYQQVYMQSEQEMQAAYAQEMEGLIGRMTVIVEALGAERGYTVVLEKTEGGVVWSPATIDITAEVVKRYDAKHGG